MSPEPQAGDVWIDANGCLTELVDVDGQEVVIHYDDIPESDITTVRGVRCTTPLRTVIDIAAEVEPDELELIVGQCFDRHLFTLEEAMARLAKPDVRSREGALVLRKLLETDRYIS